MSNKAVHKEGYLNGMRASGRLLADVPNHLLELSPELEKEISDAFNESMYSYPTSKIYKELKEAYLQTELYKERYKAEKAMARFWHTVAIDNGLTYDVPVDN